MDIATTLDITVEEEAQLAAVLGTNAEGLPERMAAFGRAAMREYANMLLGGSTLRSPDNREERLLLIILEAFDGQVPDEADVALWFNLTGSGAGALIRKVLSRYHLRLDQSIRTASVKILEGCGDDQDGIRLVAVTNPVIIEHLNRTLSRLNGELKRITRESGTAAIYRVPEDSYQALCVEFGM
jgi:hypothetical protein